jgi:hypothetical protein
MKSSTLEIDREIARISERIISDIKISDNKTISDESYARKLLKLSDFNHTTRLFHELESASPGSACVLEKRAVIKALIFSTWLQRLYFIVRSFLMTAIGGVIAFIFIMLIGKIDLALGILLGIIIFISTLFITRFFDVHIIRFTDQIIQFLGRHPKARDFIMDYF